MHLFLLQCLPLVLLAGFLVHLLLPALPWQPKDSQRPWLAAGFPMLSFVLAGILLWLWTQRTGSTTFWSQHLWIWWSSPKWVLSVSLRWDALSMLWVFLLTGLGSLLPFAIPEPPTKEGHRRQTLLLGLQSAMLWFFLSSGLWMLLVGWQAVSIFGALLLATPSRAGEPSSQSRWWGFQFSGDAGLWLGLVILLSGLQQLSTTSPQTLDFATVQSQLSKLTTLKLTGLPLLEIVGLLWVLAIVGKSAQHFFSVWLTQTEDSPVSAQVLLQSFTVVVMGVFLLARLPQLTLVAPLSMMLLMLLVGTSAVMAAGFAFFQHSLPRALAYVTITQVGLALLSAAMGDLPNAMLLLVATGLLRAALWMMQGSLLPLLQGQTDLLRMGALFRHKPLLGIAWSLACLGLAGLPGTSVFLAMRQLLERSLSLQHPSLGRAPGLALALLTLAAFALLTLALTRLVALLCFGDCRGERKVRESLPSATFSSPSRRLTCWLVLLSGLVIGGAGFLRGSWLSLWLQPLLSGEPNLFQTSSVFQTSPPLLASATISGLLVFVQLLSLLPLLWWYSRNPRRALAMEQHWSEQKKGLWGVLVRWWQQEARWPQWLSAHFSPAFQRSHSFLVDTIEGKAVQEGLQHAGAMLLRWSRGLRWLQSGNLRLYLVGAWLGLFSVLLLWLLASASM